MIVLDRVRLHISGRVQGVFYRQSAQEMAKSLNINGWVKNLTDASVLIEAEGSPENIKAFIAWCEHGPPRAHVEAVALEWLAEEMESGKSKEAIGFKIIR
jgi:acylphosphatase